MKADFARALAQGARAPSRRCNLFATAKVGTPNMIFPSTLDVGLRNFQDTAHYVQLTDHFFPEHAK